MKWFNTFKMYNLKKLKTDWKISFGICITILFTTILGTTIQLVDKSLDLNNNNSAKEINGGDLKIISDFKSENFYNELKNLESKGYEIFNYEINSGSFFHNKNKILSRAYVGNFNLKENEIIISKSIADSLNLKIGDIVDFSTEENYLEKFIVKEIEILPKGIDNDGELLGYGKINRSISNVNNRLGNITIINGENINAVKTNLQNIEDSFIYSDLNDSINILKSKNQLQVSLLNILSFLSYILTIFCLLSIIMIIIVKRKKDIAILRLVNIPLNDIKKSIILEISLLISFSVFIGIFFACYINKYILKIFSITNMLELKNYCFIGFKSFLLNIICFMIFSYFTLKILDKIKPNLLIRADKHNDLFTSKMLKKFFIIIFSLATFITISMSGLNSFLKSLLFLFGIFIILGLLSIITIYLLKIINSIKFKKNEIIYQISNLKDNKINYTLIISSISFSLLLLLLSISFNSVITQSFDKNVETKLSYNYYITAKDDLNIDLQNASKFNEYYAKINEKSKYKLPSNVSIKSTTFKDYNLKLNILEGNNLFIGEPGILISKKFKNILRKEIGDTIKFSIDNENFEYIIKGIYEDGGINSTDIYSDIINIPKLSNKNIYLINSENNKFLLDLNDIFYIKINELGNGYLNILKKYTELFKLLSIISILASLALSANLSYINSKIEEKNNMILRYLCLDKIFFAKTLLIKMILQFIFSSFISISLYLIINNVITSMLFNTNSVISLYNIFIALIINILIILFINCFEFKQLFYSKKNIYLLKE